MAELDFHDEIAELDLAYLCLDNAAGNIDFLKNKLKALQEAELIKAPSSYMDFCSDVHKKADTFLREVIAGVEAVSGDLTQSVIENKWGKV